VTSVGVCSGSHEALYRRETHSGLTHEEISDREKRKFPHMGEADDGALK